MEKSEIETIYRCLLYTSHSLTAGMNAHISKPVDMKTLEKTIRSIKSGGGGGVPKRRSLLSNH